MTGGESLSRVALKTRLSLSTTNVAINKRALVEFRYWPFENAAVESEKLQNDPPENVDHP